MNQANSHNALITDMTICYEDGLPVIHSEIYLQFFDQDEGSFVEVAIPLTHALVLLNLLRHIESEAELEDWSERIGTDILKATQYSHSTVSPYPYILH